MKRKNLNKKLFPGIVGWCVLLAVSTAGYFFLKDSTIFSGTSRLLLPAGLIAIVTIMLGITVAVHKKGVVVMNVILSAFIAGSCLLVPNLERRERNIFSEPAQTDVRKVSFYVMGSTYRSSHAELFSTLFPSESFADYTGATFIVQDEFNQEDQASALRAVETELGTEIKTLHAETVYDAIEAFYNGDGDILVLNEAFIPAAEQVSRWKNFNRDAFTLHTITLGEEVSAPSSSEQEMDSFLVYIAGGDTRSSALSLYGRTDVDMIMAVNPGDHQILLVSIPRDFYLANPALNNGLDKLTHLGNDGIDNTLSGINQLFSVNIENYLVTNFAHFVMLVDAIGGIDIDNPYEFSTVGSNGSAVTVDGVQYGGEYVFPAGMIHLDGNMALSYARERYSLSDGDYGRNQHQGIAMQGILTKIQQLSANGDYLTVINALTEHFLTNLNIDSLYTLYKASSDAGKEWDFVKYHLGGEGTYDGTASMGFDNPLYVCKPFDSQVQFVNEQISLVMSGEIIEAKRLPDNALTTYVEN